MTNFPAFSTNQLQTSLALLRSATTLQELCERLEAEVARRTRVEEVTRRAEPVVKASIPCPTPGCSGVLTRWEMSTRAVGSLVIGCRQCRYSRLEVEA